MPGVAKPNCLAILFIPCEKQDRCFVTDGIESVSVVFHLDCLPIRRRSSGDNERRKLYSGGEKGCISQLTRGRRKGWEEAATVPLGIG
jgi:hypothetical protein